MQLILHDPCGCATLHHIAGQAGAVAVSSGSMISNWRVARDRTCGGIMLIYPELNSGRVSIFLALAVGCMALVGCVADIVLTGYPGPTVQQTLHRFSIMRDASLPTWTASVILLACAALLAIAGRVAVAAQSAHAEKWRTLAVIFVLLSMDEVATMHELSGILIGRLVPSVAQLGGIFHYKWVLVALPLLVALTAYVVPWLFALPTRTRQLFIASAIVFVSGAMGVEMLNGLLDASTRENGIYYALGTTVEECMEFGGALLFLHALLDYLRGIGVSLSPVQNPVTNVAERDAPPRLGAVHKAGLL